MTKPLIIARMSLDKKCPTFLNYFVLIFFGEYILRRIHMIFHNIWYFELRGFCSVHYQVLFSTVGFVSKLILFFIIYNMFGMWWGFKKEPIWILLKLFYFPKCFNDYILFPSKIFPNSEIIFNFACIVEPISVSDCKVLIIYQLWLRLMR
jgi:hypothetical protein